jgi:hypothetical protein
MGIPFPPTIDPAISFDSSTQSAKPASLSPPANLDYLTGDPQQVAIRVNKDWSDQNRLYKRRFQEWRVNRARRAGIPGVFLIKHTDTQEWMAYFPPGTQRQVPALNKAARVARTVRAMMFVDPPVLEAQPAKDSDQARDAAEFSTRALADLSGESGYDDDQKAAEAFDLASTYGSGYRRYYVEPGADVQPVQVLAHPAAQAINPEDPGSALVDPATGEQAQPPYVSRYVKQDFTLTEDANDPNVQKRGLDVVRCEVLPAPQVRLIPATSKDIWQAEGAIIASYQALGDLRRRYPKQMAALGGQPGMPGNPADDPIKKLVSYFPENTDDLLPGGKVTREALLTTTPDDSSLVWTVTMYFEAGARFPKGFYAVVAGQDTLLVRDTWWDTQNNCKLLIPLDQLKQFAEEGNPHGLGYFGILGPGNEIRHAQLGAMLEHLDRFLNRKVFYPVTSSLQPKSAQLMTGTYIPISPGGMPSYEQVPDFPSATMQMWNLISTEMDSEGGIQPPATGANPPSVQSAIHARTIIEQVNVGLSELRNNVIRGMTRGWRIALQLVRWRYTQPRRLAWVGDDGTYKERNWTATDLGGTEDVELKAGSLSMLSPTAKAAVAEQLFAIRDPATNRSLMSLDELRSVIIGNEGGLLGLEDDPNRQRVRRQIEQWAAGPPGGGIDRQVQQDPETGQVVPDQQAQQIWMPSPADDDPTVAQIRYYELGRLLASTRFSRWDAAWQAPVLAEYQHMRQASGVQTVAEQQAAAAAQQAAQQQPPQPGATSGVPPEQLAGAGAPAPAGPAPEIVQMQQQLAGIAAQVQGLSQAVALSHAQPQAPGAPITLVVQPAPVAQAVHVMPDGQGGFMLTKTPLEGGGAPSPEEPAMAGAGVGE